MAVSKSEFGKNPYGENVDVFTLTNPRGIRVRIMTHGATVLSIETPDRNGTLADITLGFDTAAEYGTGTPYFGSTIGRFGNRIANGKVSLDGNEYQIRIAHGATHALHGGVRGFDQRMWNAEMLESDSAVQMSYFSPNGEEGFPGNLSVTVRYTLTNENELKMEYTATTDQATPVNLTHHSYFNLAGHDSGPCLNHMVMMNADTFVVTDADGIPTGEIRPVENSPMDFRAPTAIGARINETYDPLSILGRPGYDFTYCLRQKSKGELTQAAHVEDPVSGRVLKVLTTEPGIQFYSGNFLSGTDRGKGGCLYAHRSGFCLETQHYPDSPNRPEFPSTILRPGSIYKSLTIYQLS